jgi:fumarylacetoacetase
MTRSWVPVTAGSPFPVGNLPYGIFTTIGEQQRRRIGVAIGDFVLDAGALASAQRLPYADRLNAESLNPFMASGPSVWEDFRACLTAWLSDDAYRHSLEPLLVPLADVRLHLAFQVGDYVDFYSSEHHATNLGRLLRPGQPPLHPNWKHLPVGYHGRAGTVRISGTPVLRPRGQRLPAEGAPPIVGPSQRLDFEAEVGFVVGVGSEPGHPLPVEDFASHVFGVCLVNDWSARDIQAWEYAPLGPMLGKSFLTSVSPWLVPLAALETARVSPPPRDPDVLGYLDDADCHWGLDIELSVCLNGQQISRPPLREMYWTAPQQLAHLTINGANVRTGDLFASGTVSGPEPDQCGSLMELTWAGQHPLTLAAGATRSFLEDGDEVVISATAPGADGQRIGFGDVRGRVR